MNKVSAIAIIFLILVGVISSGCNNVSPLTLTPISVASSQIAVDKKNTPVPSLIPTMPSGSNIPILSTPDNLSARGSISEQEGCIPPLGAIAYRPLLIPGSVSQEPPVLPLGEWTQVTDLPESAITIRRIIARSADEIWVLLNPTNGEIWRYRVSKNEWTSFSDVNLQPVEFFDVVYTQQGKLLTLGLMIEKESSRRDSGTIVVGRFDDRSDSFLLGEVNYDALIGLNIATKVKADLDGMLWFMTQPKDGRFPNSLVADKPLALLSYDASTGAITDHGEFAWPGIFDIAPDGSIWLLDFNSDIGRRYLTKYSPDTNQRKDFLGLPPGDPDIENASHLNNLYFDRSNRLWIGDQGWVDFQNPNAPVWYQLIRPSVFLTDQSGQTSGGDNQFLLTTWAIYDQIFQSHDGAYWFGSNYGLVRLDSKTGEWCKFTNGTSPFAEDDQSNLWIALFGKLYKHTLQQE